ncbi:MAG TPA: amidohydrolase family protein [Vicinamibacterales bacterium]|nr:amidohydrolase family protein [Vicinamibacterales bacterium]
MQRRDFLSATTSGILGLAIDRRIGAEEAPESIIDIHQHVGYQSRTDAALIAHQRAMGATMTVLLPAGRPVVRPSTHEGAANGLEAKCLGNDACFRLARANKRSFRFGANEVPDLPDATAEIARYLRQGAVIIAEQKFGAECDSADMQRIYALAAENRVPVLMHWQFERFNYGFERFYTMLEKFPRVNFIGHAQTWWGNIDKNHDQKVMYPKGPVTPGGLTDRYLSDYGNIYGDLSAQSGQNALTRDEDFTRDFLARHQSKLLFGSDCTDAIGAAPGCIGAQTIAVVRRLAPSKAVERRLLHDNAKRLLAL